MIKRFWIIFASIALIFATILTSCFIVNSEEDDSLPAPSVLKGTASSTQYSISIPYIKNMEYANILRQKCLDKDFIESETVKITTENIGQVNVNTEKNISNIPSFAFDDYYTLTGTYYCYAVRYYDGTSYTTTKYSDAAEGLGTTKAELTVTSPTVTYTRNDSTETYMLSVAPDVTLPTTDFTILSVILSNGSISRPFPIISGLTTTSVAESDMVILDLRGTLTDDYLGVPLEVKGLIAINKTSDTSETYFRYYWTSFLTDFNFSVDSSGAQDTSDLRFIVPTRLSASNDLDATASKVPERAVLNIQ
ncbi:MAG: hypothetical protein IJ558_03190 [Treponema sp.]|nr:hypothetical protein [Treponema sp.]